MFLSPGASLPHDRNPLRHPCWIQTFTPSAIRRQLLAVLMEFLTGTPTFEQHRDEVAKEFGYDKPSEAMKNFDVAASFIERVYTAGHRLPKLEEIVKRISALAP